MTGAMPDKQASSCAVDQRIGELRFNSIALLTVDSVDGNVVDVRMAQSCGSVILDNATVDAFRRWHFKSGSVERVQVPITYTLTGASY